MTILLLHRPSKKPLMVRTFLKVYMELGSYFLFLQEQIKDIIISLAARRLLDPTSWQRIAAQYIRFRVKGHMRALPESRTMTEAL